MMTGAKGRGKRTGQGAEAVVHGGGGSRREWLKGWEVAGWWWTGQSKGVDRAEGGQGRSET